MIFQFLPTHFPGEIPYIDASPTLSVARTGGNVVVVARFATGGTFRNFFLFGRLDRGCFFRGSLLLGYCFLQFFGLQALYLYLRLRSGSWICFRRLRLLLLF